MYINGHYYHDDIINEEKIFGVKVDKNKLNDEAYVKELIKDINKASKGKNKSTFIDKIMGILLIISLLSIVGIPVAILLSFLSIEINKVKYDINTKDLKKIDNYLEKCLKKLRDAEAKAEGKEKKQYQEEIKKIENNRKRLHDKVNVTGPRKRELYGETLTEEEIKKFYNLIKKDLSPIVNDYNKNKKSKIRKEIDDYLDNVIPKDSDEDEIQWWKDEFGKYYNSAVPTVKCEHYENYDNKLFITLFENIGKQLGEALIAIRVEIANDFKQKTKLSNLIISVREDYYSRIVIEYNVLKVKEYLNSSIKESYNPNEGGQVKVNKINTLANIARNYGITESGNLRDEIVSEYTDILESLDTVEESVINHDISLLPVYKINEAINIFDRGYFAKYRKEDLTDNCKDPSDDNEEGYAIDLYSLKSVVESKEVSLEEAIQEIRDVNYIGDTIPMYCVLPENINEKMNIESFIELNTILQTMYQ